MKGNFTFFAIVLGFFSGVAAHSFVDFSPAFIYFLLLVSFAVLIYFLSAEVFSKEKEDEIVFKKTLSLLAIVAVSFSVGLLRYGVSVDKNESLIASYVGESLKAVGLII